MEEDEDEIVLLPVEALEDLPPERRICSTCEEMVTTEYAWIGDELCCEECCSGTLADQEQSRREWEAECALYASENCEINSKLPDRDDNVSVGDFLNSLRHNYTNYDSLIHNLGSRIRDRIRYNAIRCQIMEMLCDETGLSNLEIDQYD